MMTKLFAVGLLFIYIHYIKNVVKRYLFMSSPDNVYLYTKASPSIENIVYWLMMNLKTHTFTNILFSQHIPNKFKEIIYTKFNGYYNILIGLSLINDIC